MCTPALNRKRAVTFDSGGGELLLSQFNGIAYFKLVSFVVFFVLFFFTKRFPFVRSFTLLI